MGQRLGNQVTVMELVANGVLEPCEVGRVRLPVNEYRPRFVNTG